MRFDNRPGGLDGPPAGPTVAERTGRAFGACFFLLVIMLASTGVAWCIAWLIANFPTS